MAFPIVGLVIGGAIASVAAIGLAVRRGAVERQLLAELRGGQTRSIDVLVHGEVARVVGNVDAHERVLRAPLSGRPCVAWEVSIWQAISTRAFRKCVSEAKQVSFTIRDSTGLAHVMSPGPKGTQAKGYSVVDHEERYETSAALSEAARAFVESGGYQEALPVGTVTHFKESILALGELAVVVGYVRREADAGGRSSYRQSAAEVQVELHGKGGAPVLFSDAPEAIDSTRARVVERVGQRSFKAR